MWQMTGLYNKGQFKPHVYVNQLVDKSEANALAKAIFFDENCEFRKRVLQWQLQLAGLSLVG